jgi:serine/threonine protein phosphatase 1
MAFTPSELRNLGNLVRRRVQSARVRPRVPDGERIYAVGDIHGRADLLERLHRTIEEDASSQPDIRVKVVYLGDYIDRGHDSKAVLDLLVEQPLAGVTSIYLKGNHEDALLRFLEDKSNGPRWFAIGGNATALSYGVRIPSTLPPSERLDHVWRELHERICEAHLDFLWGLQLAFRAGDYFFAHAGIKPGRPLDEQHPLDLMWIRGEFLRSRKDHQVIVVHGHSPKPSVDVRPNRIGIDTLAYATNVLTCLVLEGDTRRFLSTS